MCEKGGKRQRGREIMSGVRLKRGIYKVGKNIERREYGTHQVVHLHQM